MIWIIVGCILLGFVWGWVMAYFVKRTLRYDGTIDIVETDEKISFVLNVDGDPNDIPNMKELIFRVNGAQQHVLREENKG